jgi:hypothetical protein
MLCDDNVTNKGTQMCPTVKTSFLGCICDHNRERTTSFTWFTLSASAMSAIFVSLVGFKVGNVLPEMEFTNSLLMNNCNKKNE